MHVMLSELDARDASVCSLNARDPRQRLMVSCSHVLGQPSAPMWYGACGSLLPQTLKPNHGACRSLLSQIRRRLVQHFSLPDSADTKIRGSELAGVRFTLLTKRRAVYSEIWHGNHCYKSGSNFR